MERLGLIMNTFRIERSDHWLNIVCVQCLTVVLAKLPNYRTIYCRIGEIVGHICS